MTVCMLMCVAIGYHVTSNNYDDVILSDVIIRNANDMVAWLPSDTYLYQS